MAVPAARYAWIAARAVWGAVALDQYFNRNDEEPGLSVRRLQIVYSITTAGGGAEEDVRVTTHDFVNLTSGVFDDTWTEADFLAVEDALDVWKIAMQNRFANNMDIKELRWYRLTPGTTLVGPPVRVVAQTYQGTGAGKMLPPQVAITVTERTGLAKHWGRYYLPGLHATILDDNGRLTQTDAIAMADIARNWYQSVRDHANEIIPVVFSRRLGAALAIEEIQIDDIVDVQRRRRYETTLYRERRPLS